jgi:hypothetical protein
MGSGFGRRLDVKALNDSDQENLREVLLLGEVGVPGKGGTEAAVGSYGGGTSTWLFAVLTSSGSTKGASDSEIVRIVESASAKTATPSTSRLASCS